MEDGGGGGGRRGSESILKIDGEPEIMVQSLTNQFMKVQIKQVDRHVTPSWRQNTSSSPCRKPPGFLSYSYDVTVFVAEVLNLRRPNKERASMLIGGVTSCKQSCSGFAVAFCLFCWFVFSFQQPPCLFWPGAAVIKLH